MYRKCDVDPKYLSKNVDVSKFPFETTEEVTALSTVIGQDRAVLSVTFALEIDDSGYNLFVTGNYGTGRTTIVQDLLNEMAGKRPDPPDWVYVYHFKNPDEPQALQLPSGMACEFRDDMHRLISTLKNDLLKAFESKNYLNRKNEILEKIQTEKQNLFTNLEKEALSMDIQIKSSTMGFVTVPLKNGEEIDSKKLQELTDEEQQKITQNMNYVQKRIQEVVRRANHLDRSMQDKLEKLNKEVAQYVVNNHFEPVREKYHHCKDVKQYLDNASENIVNNVQELIGSGSEAKQEVSDNNQGGLPYRLNKYQVNVVRDNSQQEGAPVIYETNPTYNNLFGRIEKRAFQGFVYTDYTMIKPGSLLMANGGYLMLEANQLLKQPFAYEALKRALRSGKLRTEDINELYGFSTSTALRPASIPLQLKVILIGSPHVYHILYNYDEEFRKIFKVRADFDNRVKGTSKTVEKYVQFIARVVKEEGLKHFDKEGVAAVIEYGYRIADHQKKLSIQFGELVKIIRESSFWAQKSRRKRVSRRDVTKAIEQKRYRHNLSEEKVHEAITEQVLDVDVSGKTVGQINGLVIYNLGDYRFGRPSKITINTFIGSRGIINIEREAKMSGNIHDKGMLTLSGYFSNRFGKNMPLSFSASITFEQSYGRVDGDSASCAELYGLLSSLSNIPIKQGIAVTGSVNQKGEVQAIGGVNEKIEGFYRVCRSRGLSGDQGVIIPKANIQNLLLDNEIVRAVEEKKFNIWAVDSIEDGMRILTAVPCGIEHKDGSFTDNSVFERVRQQLIEFARTAQQFRKNLGANANKTNEKNDSDEDN